MRRKLSTESKGNWVRYCKNIVVIIRSTIGNNPFWRRERSRLLDRPLLSVRNYYFSEIKTKTLPTMFMDKLMYKIKDIVSGKCDLLFLETHEFRNYEKIPREVLLYKVAISVEVCCPGPSRSKNGHIAIQLIRCAPNNTFYPLDSDLSVG